MPRLYPSILGADQQSVSLNLRISRSIGIGPKNSTVSGMDAFMKGGPMGGPPPGGGPRGGGPGGPGGGPGGPGGGPGGPMGMMGGGTRKYSLNFNVQIQNLFNDINYGTPSGSIVATQDNATGLYGPGSRFGKSTSLNSGMFSSGSASRKITFQMSFSF